MGGAPDHDDAPADTQDGDIDDFVGSLDSLDSEPVPFDAGVDDATRIAHARRRHGGAGAALAAGMLGIDQIVNGRKPREDAPIVVAANSDPLDIDTEGIRVSVEGADIVAPPLPRTAPVTPGKRRRSR
jgi:hypothetical protein